MEYNENLAIQICEQSVGKKYLYKGENSIYYGAVGTFHFIQDHNCCCPTDQVLFAFEVHEQKYYMTATDFLTFYNASIEMITK